MRRRVRDSDGGHREGGGGDRGSETGYMEAERDEMRKYYSAVIMSFTVLNEMHIEPYTRYFRFAPSVSKHMREFENVVTVGNGDLVVPTEGFETHFKSFELSHGNYVLYLDELEHHPLLKSKKTYQHILFTFTSSQLWDRDRTEDE
eukprot:GHVO01009609.1.p1 GENE.GHVO01009609.1~~GHVO01009609.1.p1  ORF type:complete len:146 (-),score=18.55 GHVO01009609.1:303-740(-)